MNYETAKKLKENGFPQREIGTYIGSQGTVIGSNKESVREFMNAVYVPTLSELIETCGDNVKLEVTDSTLSTATKLMSIDESNIVVDGLTPEIAFSNLWLALNKKDNK